MQHDLYRILGIEHTASDDDVKRVFRALALRFHPDRNQGLQEAEERFKEVNYAYSILGNPEKRRRYDIYCKLFPHYILEREYGLTHEHIFEKLFLDQDFGALFDQFYKVVEQPFAQWKDWLSRFQAFFSQNLDRPNPWWLFLPFLPVKVAEMTGRFFSERIPRRIGKDFSSSKKSKSYRNQARARQHGDIEMLLPLTKKELHEGTSLKVSFIRDKEWVRLRVKVPAGLQPGIRLRVRQKGNAVEGKDRRGDLYLKIAVNH